MNNDKTRAEREPACKVFTLPEIPVPDECWEAMRYLDKLLTTREQWALLRVMIEAFRL